MGTDLSFRINAAPSEVYRSLRGTFKWEWIRAHSIAPLTTIGLEESFSDIKAPPPLAEINISCNNPFSSI